MLRRVKQDFPRKDQRTMIESFLTSDPIGTGFPASLRSCFERTDAYDFVTRNRKLPYTRNQVERRKDFVLENLREVSSFQRATSPPVTPRTTISYEQRKWNKSLLPNVAKSELKIRQTMYFARLAENKRSLDALSKNVASFNTIVLLVRVSLCRPDRPRRVSSSTDSPCSEFPSGNKLGFPKPARESVPAPKARSSCLKLELRSLYNGINFISKSSYSESGHENVVFTQLNIKFPPSRGTVLLTNDYFCNSGI